MMTQVTSGSQRSETIGPQVGPVGASTKDEVIPGDFAALLHQTTDGPISKSAAAQNTFLGAATLSPDTKGGGSHPASAVKTNSPATRQETISGLLKNVGNVNQEAIVVGTADDTVSTAVTEASSVTKPASLPLEEGLPATVKGEILLPVRVGQEGVDSENAAVDHQPGKIPDAPGHKPPSGTITIDPLIKGHAKDLKVVAKQVLATAIQQAPSMVPTVAAAQTSQQGMPAAVVPVAQQSATVQSEGRTPAAALDLPQIGAMVSGASRPASLDQNVESAQKTDLAFSAPPVSTSPPASTGDDQSNWTPPALTPATGLEASATLANAGVLPSLFHGETRVAPIIDIPAAARSLGQRASGPDLPVGEHSQQAGLQHTVLAATPTSLEVGVYGGTHGWLKIRAELTGTGEVNASLRGASPATAGVLPALNSYLQSERIHVGALSVHTVLPEISASTERATDSTARDLSGGANGNAAEGNGQQREGERSSVPRQAGEDAVKVRLDEREITGAYGLGTGSGGDNTLSPVEYGADGSWLNVRV